VPDKPTQREYWSGKVGDEWASHAERIDIMLAPIAEAGLQAGAFQPSERVLDIGCGAGATSLEIARRVGAAGAVVGVDISPQMLEVARKRAQGVASVEFLEGDAGVARFDTPFDAAFSRFGVMFFEQPTFAFAHLRTTLRPGGRLAFVCWRKPSENGWATSPIAAIETMLKAPLPKPDPDAPGPFAFADAAKVERILQDAGWRDIAMTPWDGDIAVGGAGPLDDIADFLLRIGPCARAIADQQLDADEARRRVEDHLAPLYRDNRVMLSAACWITTARA
jgi:SAM-dependent methyltransferase